MRARLRRPGPHAVRGLAAILAAAALLLGGCAQSAGPGPQSEPFSLNSLAKTDMNGVAETTLWSQLGYLRTLMIKLYRRNPRQLHRQGDHTLADRVDRVFTGRVSDWNFPELGNCRGTACVNLAFDPAFKGDRVLAFVFGLTSMILASYNNHTEFYVLDRLNAQKLYNSARNIEIAVWQLSNKRDTDGHLYLYSNSRAGEVRNLSFARLFGKMIALQDNLAIIIAGRTNRVIKTVIQDMATAVFLPV